METQEQAIKGIENLRKDGDSCYFNMFQDGGAVCYLCNGMYLLFEVPLYGGAEVYEATYFENQLPYRLGMCCLSSGNIRDCPRLHPVQMGRR